MINLGQKISSFQNRIWQNTLWRRTLVIFFSSLAILGTASSCSLPGFLGGDNQDITLGVLKFDPEIRDDGFLRANSVEGIDGNIDGQALSSLSTVKLHRFDLDTLFILTREKGLFRTDDGGANWKRIYVFSLPSNDPNDGEVQNQIARNDAFIITDFGVDSRNDSVIYVSGMENNLAKIYQSLDRGQSFVEVYTEIDPGIRVLFMAVDPVNSSQIFAILEEGALLRSTDRGLTWSKIRSFRDTPIQIGFVPEFDRLFFVLFEDDGLATSNDNGLTWNARELTKSESDIGERQPKDGLDISFGNNVTFGKYEKIIPVTAGIQYNTNTNTIVNPSGRQPWLLIADRQMWLTEENDDEFRKLSLPVQNEQVDLFDVSADPQSGLGKIYASVNDRLFITRNRGQSWTTDDKINLSTPIGNIGQILIDPQRPEIIYLTVLDPEASREGGFFVF